MPTILTYIPFIRGTAMVGGALQTAKGVGKLA